MDARCRIELFGGLSVRQDDRVITRFSTHKTGALLAYLACYLDRPHPREVLIELLWPECDMEAGRARLSVALSSLRHQLEPPGVPAGALIQADRASVRLNPAAITTDVAAFEGALELAERARSRTEREQSLVQGVALYRGPLLPGYYEDWVSAAQARLAQRYLQALRQLSDHAVQARDLPRALDYARRAVGADPLCEEAHQDVMRLSVAAGQPAAALRQYRELERILKEELGETPAAATQNLARSLQSQLSDPAALLPPIEPPAPTAAPQEGGRGVRALPTGTVTFLLTGIEDSTALWERSGEAFPTALASHHALLRREFRRHGGYEVKEVGDGFVVAVERAGDAVACAVAAQRALAAHASVGAVRKPPLQVRMALHTGDVEMQEGDYHGLVLHHASRMLLAAHGGQILCSEVTAGVLRRGGIAAMEPGVQLVDLGLHRLPDVGTPERLFQVEYPEMPQREFPALKAEAGSASHLPLQFTRFFGREPELAQLRALLLSDEIRLVTLTGPGGSGKTRLAQQLAEQLVDALRGALWFVPLADLSPPTPPDDGGAGIRRLIADAARDALRLPRSPHLTSLEQVVDALSHQPALLVLDNFEHLVAEGALLIRTLLERVPTLKCLVTSRQPVDLEGEHEFHVLPLPTPNESVKYSVLSVKPDDPPPKHSMPPTQHSTLNTQHLTPKALMLYESVQLFVDRAQAVRPDFQVTNANAASVAELCRRLEGIPLAVELAATRAQVLTPAQMLAQLAHRFDFLVSRRRDVVARHRTLRAAIEWGYQLLAPELQRFFAALSVFRGGWTLEAAEAVAEEPLALDHLAQLRECSMVLAEERAAGMRFRMLETLREHASEQLEPEERTALEQRHAEYYLSLVEGEALRLEVLEEKESVDRLDAEQDNFRAALAWGFESAPEFALRLAASLGPFWEVSGYFAEGREALERALERRPDVPAELQAKALKWSGSLALWQGDLRQASSHLEESLLLSQEASDQRQTADTLHLLGRVAWMKRELTHARAFLEESLAIARELGDSRVSAEALRVLGIVRAQQGEPAVQRPLFEESLDVSRQSGYKRGIGAALHMLGLEALGRGEYAAARPLLEQGLAIFQQIADKMLPVRSLIHLGHLANREGKHAEGCALLKESLTICRRLGEKALIVECLESLGEMAGAQRQPERGARLVGAAASLREAMGLTIGLSGRYYSHSRIATLREALGEARFTAAWEAGRALTWQQAADDALSDDPDKG